MGAMKAHMMDLEELEQAVWDCDDETDQDKLGRFIHERGWISPTEREARASRAATMVAGMSETEREIALRVLREVGVEIPALNFPIRGVDRGASPKAA